MSALTWSFFLGYSNNNVGIHIQLTQWEDGGEEDVEQLQNWRHWRRLPVVLYTHDNHIQEDHHKYGYLEPENQHYSTDTGNWYKNNSDVG